MWIPHVGDYVDGRNPYEGNKENAPIEALGALVGAEVLACALLTAARPIMRKLAWRDFLSTDISFNELPREVLVLEVIPLASEAPLLDSLKLRLDRTDASARARSL
jgi:hypothetical protein